MLRTNVTHSWLWIWLKLYLKKNTFPAGKTAGNLAMTLWRSIQQNNFLSSLWELRHFVINITDCHNSHKQFQIFYQGLKDFSVYNFMDVIIVMQFYYVIVNNGQFFALSPLLVNQIDTYTDSQGTPTQLL